MIETVLPPLHPLGCDIYSGGTHIEGLQTTPCIGSRIIAIDCGWGAGEKYCTYVSIDIWANYYCSASTYSDSFC